MVYSQSFTAADLESTFDRFDTDSSSNNTFTVNEIPRIEINTAGSVAIKQSNRRDRVTVKVSQPLRSRCATNVRVYQIFDTIKIVQEQAEDRLQQIEDSAANLETTQIIIYTPRRSNLSARLWGDNSVFVSTVKLDNANISLDRGNIKAILETGSLECFCAGDTQLSATVTGGDLLVNSCDRATLKIDDYWFGGVINACDRSLVVTEGNGLGDYIVTAKDRAAIVHIGAILGDLVQNRRDNLAG